MSTVNEVPSTHHHETVIHNKSLHPPTSHQNINAPTQFIVSAYTHQIESSFPYQNNAYYNIPSCITNIILLYLQNYFINEGLYIWKIKDPQMITQMLTAKNCQKFESQTFTMAKLPWKLQIYPNGNNKELEKYFIIHLHLLSLPSMIESITFGRTFRIIESMASAPWTETLKSGEYEYWTRKCPITELLNTKSISIQVEVHIFAIKWKKDIPMRPIEYPFKSFIPITKTIFPFQQRFAYKLDCNTMEIFRNCAQGKCMCSEIINNMWVITLYPRGNQSVNGYQSYTAVYLRLVVWPNNINSLKAKFKLTCVEKNDSVEYDHTFNSDASSYGTHAWDEWIDLKDLKTLTFQVEITILSVENTNDMIGLTVADTHQISYLLTS